MDAGTIIQVIRWHKAPPCTLVHSVHNRFGDRWMYRENRSPASVPLTQTLLRIATPSKLGRAWSNDRLVRWFTVCITALGIDGCIVKTAPPCALVHSVHNRFGDRWMYRENRSPKRLCTL